MSTSSTVTISLHHTCTQRLMVSLTSRLYHFTPYSMNVMLQNASQNQLVKVWKLTSSPTTMTTTTKTTTQLRVQSLHSCFGNAYLSECALLCFRMHMAFNVHPWSTPKNSDTFRPLFCDLKSDSCSGEALSQGDQTPSDHCFVTSKMTPAWVRR